MNLSNLIAPKKGFKRKKRVGRGSGSGHGKTCCRGHKGANSRSGTTQHLASEGGQMPLIRRMPKRGFSNISRVVFQIVNIEKLGKFKDGTTADVNFMIEKGLIKNSRTPVKILGKGKLAKNLTVKANAFSKSAKKAIEENGGKVEIVSRNS